MTSNWSLISGSTCGIWRRILCFDQTLIIRTTGQSPGTEAITRLYRSFGPVSWQSLLGLGSFPLVSMEVDPRNFLRSLRLHIGDRLLYEWEIPFETPSFLETPSSLYLRSQNTRLLYGWENIFETPSLLNLRSQNIRRVQELDDNDFPSVPARPILNDPIPVADYDAEYDEMPSLVDIDTLSTEDAFFDTNSFLKDYGSDFEKELAEHFRKQAFENCQQCPVCFDEESSLRVSCAGCSLHPLCTTCMTNLFLKAFGHRTLLSEEILLHVPCPTCRRELQVVLPRSDLSLEEEFDPQDIDLVMRQTGCTRFVAINALRQNNGDLVDAIIKIDPHSIGQH